MLRGLSAIAREPGRYLAAPAGAHLGFNLSHTPGMVACAVVPDGEIGIDVECEERQLTVESLAREVCSDAERRQLDAAPAESRKAVFLDLWTLKEAYLKALGVGIADGTLAEASFDLGQLGVIQTELTQQTPPALALPHSASNADRAYRRGDPMLSPTVASGPLTRPGRRGAGAHPVRMSFVGDVGR